MSKARLIFERQWLHASLLAALLAMAILVGNLHGAQTGQKWGGSTPAWFWISIAIAVAHQIFVWFCWRTQLYAHWPTRALGNFAFPLYAVGFSVLGISRWLIVFIVAMSNQNTLPVNQAVLKFFAIVAAIPALYLLYSVIRYFGFKRALGIDHFDAGYRSLPFVRKGIFRFTRNGMYVYGFLLVWIPVLWFASLAALGVALFNHLYVWVHYYSTELPDMKQIYGKARATARS